MHLKHSRLLKYKLKYDVYLFLVTEFTRFTRYVLRNIQAFSTNYFRHSKAARISVRLKS